MNNTFKKILYLFVAFFFLILLGYLLCYYRWYPIWQPVAQRKSYSVQQNQDDTLRIVMIGDSWTGLHHKWGHDSLLAIMVQDRVSCPVTMEARGKGGAKSSEIYEMMFRESGLNPELCTQPLIETSPDYVIVTAGINDASANLGTEYYCINYGLIVSHLLACGIRPVIVEMPDVDIKGLYGDKPLKDKLVDRLRSLMTGVSLYDVKPYRESLRQYLQDNHMLDSVVYVDLSHWKPDYITDGIHLSNSGYHQLDSCLSVFIVADLEKAVDSNMVKKPVNANAEE